MGWWRWCAGGVVFVAAALVAAGSGGGSGDELARAGVVAPGSPVLWALDHRDATSAGPARVSGWVGSSKPATITVTLDSTELARVRAGQARFDVSTAYGLDPEVGFDIVFDELPFGTYDFCVRADTKRSSVDMGCHIRTALPPRAAEPTASLVVNGAGDVYTNPAWFTNDGETDFEPLLDGLGGLLRRDDLTVVNMDCTPSSTGSPVWKRFNLRCPRPSLRELAADGVDVVSQANNHSIDYGVSAMLDGQSNLRRAGLLPVGAGRSAEEAFTPQLVEVNGWRVAVFGFAEFVEFEWWYATRDGPGVASGKDLDAVTSAIARYDDLVDVVVVSVHWGVERTFEPTPAQTSGASAMVRAGADVIFGHHPHWVQPLRRVRGVPVFYSLGNFVWFHLGGPASDSAIGQVVFRRSGKVKACILDAQITAPGSVVLEGPSRC